MALLHRPIALIILDGWGIGCQGDLSNAIARARTPNMTRLQAQYPSTSLVCSGEAVGLPDGQMGNSEVGHLNIGAGRIVYQELTRISKAIRDGDFFDNAVLQSVMTKAQAANGALHLMGLLSDGGVHSHISHLFALLEMAKRQGIKEVYVHAFLDGRDVPPSSARSYISQLEAKMRELGIGKIATVSGRYYAMDRDKRWPRVEKAYAAMVYGQGNQVDTAQAGLEEAYARGETDEFVLPMIVRHKELCTIKANDGVVFFNFRPDRAREMTRALTDKEFAGFERQTGSMPLYFATMTQYDELLAIPVAFKPSYLHNTLGEVWSQAGYRQLRTAETEKYAHVTFFFNGGEERAYDREERILIQSPSVATYDLQPAMSALELTERLLHEINYARYDFIVLNYANCDMVGHTGKLDAAICAVETVDECVGKIVDAVLERGGIAFITADHGNAELMVDKTTGEPHTAHTVNVVPFIMVSDYSSGCKLNTGSLADIAPTILEAAGLAIPADMTGRSLVRCN